MRSLVDAPSPGGMCLVATHRAAEDYVLAVLGRGLSRLSGEHDLAHGRTRGRREALGKHVLRDRLQGKARGRNEGYGAKAALLRRVNWTSPRARRKLFLPTTPAAGFSA
jgi:hypothetical protein